ncbi:MAG: hypothetical protein JW910_18070 [Anaerolineae bacterium]|nr:hypothetical protein [Anaerolineae bacterium]
MNASQLQTTARVALVILLLVVGGHLAGLVGAPTLGMTIIAGLFITGWLLLTGHISPGAAGQTRKRHVESLQDFAWEDNPDGSAYVELDELRAVALDGLPDDNEVMYE